jgi:hypothetical protein
MTLTEASLEQAIMEIMGMVNDSGQRIDLKPTKLIVSYSMLRDLMYLPPIKKARGMRKRKRALTRRGGTLFWKLFRGKHDKRNHG